jgi:hypothetical protein
MTTRLTFAAGERRGNVRQSSVDRVGSGRIDGGGPGMFGPAATLGVAWAW